MIDLTGVTHHPAIEEIVEVLTAKTQNTDRGFFRCEVAYFLGKMASNMRATIVTKDRGDIPVNIYALALATSGFGKGHSVNIMENEFMKPFKKRFMEDAMPVIAEQNLWEIANDRALRQGTDPQEEFNKVEAEYKRAGAYPFTFDSGTAPAVKQLRHKLLLANCGSINLQIDEIGSNLINAVEVLTLFLELYDQGQVKQKLTKNTAENTRAEEMDGKTPTNMLLFGTPAKLLDGAQTEDQFYSFLETGYARRCLFGFGQHTSRASNTQSAEEIYRRLIAPTNSNTVTKWSNQFQQLADPAMYGWKMLVEDDVAIRLLEYKIACDRMADTLPDHEEIRKAEISHRYFKALKLAGAYAFIDQSSEVEMGHLMQAIFLVEESGTAFQTILTREKAYVKLAKYIGTCGTEVTESDLGEALPFFKGGANVRRDMMTLATAWGYKNNVIVKKTFVDGIEFFKGETLKETSLDEMLVSYSHHWAYHFQAEKVPFNQLHNLTQADGYHYVNHAFKNGHRAEENVIVGFNMIVIDVDEGISLPMAHEVMKDYRFLTHTTKRHQTEGHGDRFRMLIPLNYHLELDNAEYKEFMDSIFAWLPFQCDEGYRKREHDASSFAGGTYHYNDGSLLDVLPFIPKTSKNEQYRDQFQAVQNLGNLERWFAQRMANGSRNNQMLKYAMALVDSGMQLMEVSQAVHALNTKINTPLPDDEISNTILVTVAKRFQRTA